jgi:hypothetical protein
VFDHRRQIVEPRFPSEREQAAVVRNQANRIPGPSLGDTFLKHRSGDTFHGSQDLFYRITPAIAAIQSDAVSSAAQKVQRQDVRVGEVRNMEEVANASAVRGGVVIAVDFDVWLRDDRSSNDTQAKIVNAGEE